MLAAYVVMIPAAEAPAVYGVFRSTATAEAAAARWNERRPADAPAAVVVPVHPAAELARRDPTPPAPRGPEPGWSRRFRRGQGRSRPPMGPSSDGPPPGPKTVL